MTDEERFQRLTERHEALAESVELVQRLAVSARSHFGHPDFQRKSFACLAIGRC